MITAFDCQEYCTDGFRKGLHFEGMMCHWQSDLAKGPFGGKGTALQLHNRLGPLTADPGGILILPMLFTVTRLYSFGAACPVVAGSMAVNCHQTKCNDSANTSDL